jgi:hypothetical protein
MGPSFVGRARLKAQQVPHLVARSGVVCVSGGETRGPPGRYKRSEANGGLGHCLSPRRRAAALVTQAMARNEALAEAAGCLVGAALDTGAGAA